MDCPSTWARSRCSNAGAISPFSRDLSAQIISASICSLSLSIPNDCKPRLGPRPTKLILPTASFFAVNVCKRKFQLLLEETSSKKHRSGIAQTDVPTIDETNSFPFPYSAYATRCASSLLSSEHSAMSKPQFTNAFRGSRNLRARFGR